MVVHVEDEASKLLKCGYGEEWKGWAGWMKSVWKVNEDKQYCCDVIGHVWWPWKFFWGYTFLLVHNSNLCRKMLPCEVTSRASTSTRVINYPGIFLLPDGYPGYKIEYSTPIQWKRPSVVRWQIPTTQVTEKMCVKIKFPSITHPFP